MHHRLFPFQSTQDRMIRIGCCTSPSILTGQKDDIYGCFTHPLLWLRVHKKNVIVYTFTPEAKEIRTFSTMTEDLID